uniref:ADAM metallopeptidase with thrombospondin type 1 motif, 12 n=1 Tax=Oryzias sinensis TaxID=183150 RepID=A0A8C8A0A4_9TELE
MPCSWGCAILSLLHFVFILAGGHKELPDTLLSLLADQGQCPDLSVVHPVKTSADGEFISNEVSHHFKMGRHRRDLQGQPPQRQVYYQLSYKGRNLKFNLTANEHLISNDYVLEKRKDNTTEHRFFHGNSCHLIGTVEASGVRGTAAISTCKGLTGFFSLPEGHFFIERVQKSPDDALKKSLHLHVISYTANASDAPSDSMQAEREREEWEREQQRAGAQPRSHRSVSRERWVETMVVADSKLIEYHGSEHVESYIFTIMNMVAGIFHDASIGNAIHVILVRLILLQGQEKGLKIVHNADTTLASFCAWQKHLNPQNDAHPAHHDLGILITRKDICAGMNQPCETLGLSHLSGMCQPHRSCNINEDSGLPVAFTVAHEMGHSFGIQHDGQGNDCELQGRHPFIMSRQLMYDSSPLTWSSCSKDYITRFLDRGWGFCLDDRPSKRDIATPLARLGIRYTTHHQCQLQYGPNATFCPEVDNVCQILWCSVNGSCRSKLDSPIDGTRCGPEKWCISGECVIVGKLPETVNGGWGQWSTWSYCSRTCGTGVQSAERECNNPKPEFGGRYCTGERKRYRTCNTKPCQRDKPTFREMLCSEFDTVPYHNELYHWIPVFSPTNPCELHCQPVGEFFSERMLDIVTDGTPCFMNNKSRNICVNGVCKDVGCDYGIESNAVEDRCGVCLGDGTSCQTVSKSFDQGEEFGYVDVGVIPEGARYISVKEASEVGNFLALKSVESEEYFLNGNFIIQWNGEYEVGGTTFYYERNGNVENLTAPGPTKHPVMLQLLIQEKNPGIKYEYIIKKTKDSENEVTEPIYFWRHGAWTACSTTCGSGEQHQPVRCFQADMGVVDESLCDSDSRPDDKLRQCKNMECPARWWVGSWQQCTATCGSEGVRKRTVLCVRTVSWEERVLHPVECKHLLKPKPVVPCNRDVPCGKEWAVSSWGECSATCGGGVRSRNVTCALTPRKACNLAAKPRSRSLCALQNCPNSSLYRKPGFLSMSRRISPPRTPPSQHPGTTAAPTSTKKEATTNFMPKTTSLPDFEHTTPEIIDADGFDFSFGMRKIENPKNSTKTESQKKVTLIEDENLEEGSTPTMLMYTAGYDYVVEDMTTTAEDKIIKTSNAKDKKKFTLQVFYKTCLYFQTKYTSIELSFKEKRPFFPQCSTTCGIGAVWRAVTCSSQNDEDCAKMKRPEPARTCHLQPCATWQAGSWSKRLGAKCGANLKICEICTTFCFSKRPLRPFHCQAVSSRPVSTLVCPHNPCMNWDVSTWGPCTGSCGEGIRERRVFCAEPHHCSTTQKPNSTEPCSLEPCTHWKSGDWEECSVSCGGGQQRRSVKCVTERESAVVPNSRCEKILKPVTLRMCSMQECSSACRKNAISSRFCEKLKLLGRCTLRSVQRQCCVTCRP